MLYKMDKLLNKCILCIILYLIFITKTYNLLSPEDLLKEYEVRKYSAPEQLEPNDLVFIIMSQKNKYHNMKAVELKFELIRQLQEFKNKDAAIFIPHEHYTDYRTYSESWQIYPIFPRIYKHFKMNKKWAVFLQDRTYVNISRLISTLREFNPYMAQWLGYAVYDEESTIIHHYSIDRLMNFPLLASGFVITMNMIGGLVSENKLRGVKNDFAIDASYELALLLETHLFPLPYVFCTEKGEHCATYPLPDLTDCDNLVAKDNIFFAVKTFNKFHKTRIPVIKNTWGKEAIHIEYFSDLKDPEIPTTSVGIPNTESGHCEKTFKIFELVEKRFELEPHLEWLVLADDDTLLSVRRLQEILSCWDSNEQIVMGERYGYALSRDGFTYLTGGGGIVLSKGVLPLIIQECRCYKRDYPDDMFLGMCLKMLDIPIVHSSDFHQARPDDYPSGYLQVQRPVSFHKFWNIDPYAVYEKWFGQQKLNTNKSMELINEWIKDEHDEF